MPFWQCGWVDGTAVPYLGEEPTVELRQTDRKQFVVLKTFCYEVPNGDPHAGTIYVIPGEDAPSTAEIVSPSADVVVPPHEGGKTDLASVPWFMWWLVASYGNHTRAALLHDSLYVDKGTPPVSRATADRLLLTALREPGQKSGAFRHWLMWAAVSVFGTLRHALFIFPILFCLQLFAVWGLVTAAVIWAPESTAWPESIANAPISTQIGYTVGAVAILLILLGTTWRSGVDLRGGWLVPITLLMATIAVPLWREWSEEFDASQTTRFWLLLAAGGLMLLGLPWGLGVDPTLRWWLWPTALIGLPIALIPLLFVFLSVGLVWLIDLGASLAAAPRKENGARRGFQIPGIEPYRWPL